MTTSSKSNPNEMKIQHSHKIPNETDKLNLTESSKVLIRVSYGVCVIEFNAINN